MAYGGSTKGKTDEVVANLCLSKSIGKVAALKNSPGSFQASKSRAFLSDEREL